MKEVMTLCFVQNRNRILLGMKKRGFGKGRWNGFGGKVCGEETVEDAARRELLEESGIEARKIDQRGVLLFEFAHTGEMHEVYIFKVTSYKGTPTESEEMRPQWFLVREIPFHSMWPDDPYWYPLFLRGAKFKGVIKFSDYDTIVAHAIYRI